MPHLRLEAGLQGVQTGGPGPGGCSPGPGCWGYPGNTTPLLISHSQVEIRPCGLVGDSLDPCVFSQIRTGSLAAATLHSYVCCCYRCHRNTAPTLQFSFSICDMCEPAGDGGRRLCLLFISIWSMCRKQALSRHGCVCVCVCDSP